MMGKSEYEAALAQARKADWLDLQNDWADASQRPMRPAQIQALASRWAKFYQNMDRITDSDDLAETLAEATVEAANDLWDRENNDAPVEFLVGRVLALLCAYAAEFDVPVYEAGRSFLAQCINQKMPSPLDDGEKEDDATKAVGAYEEFFASADQEARGVYEEEVPDGPGDVDNQTD